MREFFADFLAELVFPFAVALLLLFAFTWGFVHLAAHASTNSGHFRVVEHRPGGADIVYDCGQIQWCDEHRIQVWTTDGRNLVIAGSWSVEEIKPAEETKP